MTTSTVNDIALSAEVREKLLAQAKAEGRPEAELLDEAVRTYLQRRHDEEPWELSAGDEAELLDRHEEVKRGDWVSSSEVLASLDNA